MNRTYMQKGIGAAPFAIVAALILALTVGFWATQTAQAEDKIGDVALTVEDVHEEGTGFNEPGPATGDVGSDGATARTAARGLAYGPAGHTVELPTLSTSAITDAVEVDEHALEKAFAADGGKFRGAVARSGRAWVEITARVILDPTALPTAAERYVAGDVPYKLDITVTGAASLSSSASVTTATCTSDSGGLPPQQVCQFAVYTTGAPGPFTVKVDPSVANVLTSTPAKRGATLKGQWVGPAVSADVLDAAPATTGVRRYRTADYDSDTTDDTNALTKAFVTSTGARIMDNGNVAVDTDEDGVPDSPEEEIVVKADGVFEVDKAKFGLISQEHFNIGTNPGLGKDTDGSKQVGFLFQLEDRVGQVAMNLTAADRNSPAVVVTTTLGTAFKLEPGMSVVGGYAKIEQEGELGNYPAIYDGADSDAEPDAGLGTTGGLVAVGLVTRTADDGGGMGSICIDIDDDGVCEAEQAFAVAGNVDGAMSFVSAITTGPVNLGKDAAHVRVITLRDANGVPINGKEGAAATILVRDTSEATGDNLVFGFEKTATDAAAAAKVRDGDDAAKSVTDGVVPADKDGAYYIGISALTGEVGSHSFSVSIGSGNAKKVHTLDADSNPLEAHIGDTIKALAVTSVTDLAGEELLANGEVTVGPYDLITITLSATGKDGEASKNGSVINALGGAGFAGTSSNSTLTTDDAGEGSISYRAGDATQAVAFRAAQDHGTGSTSLLVRVVDPDAPVVTGPVIYSLVDSAASTFVTWQGGDVSSSVFENVADLVRVWKWTGSMWVGYNSNPAAPAGTKTSFILSNNDIIYVVSNGPVSLSLG